MNGNANTTVTKRTNKCQHLSFSLCCRCRSLQKHSACMVTVRTKWTVMDAKTEGAAQGGLVACERVQELCRCYDHRSVSCSPNGGQIQPEVCTQEKAMSRINSRSVHMVVPVCPNSTLLVSRTILTSMRVQCCGTAHRECFKRSLHFKFQRCPRVCSDCSTGSVHVIKVFHVGTFPDRDGTEHTDAEEQELHHQ